jgi:hypothetical protein
MDWNQIMTRLPQTTDFNALDFPELSGIFRQIDAGIAAIIASDPAFRPKAPHKRRSTTAKLGRTASRSGRVQRRAA